jgi:hypothetical protein
MLLAVATLSGRLELSDPDLYSKTSLSPTAPADHSDHSSKLAMKEKDSIETNEETRARGVKRTSDIKIAEVSTSKKKRAKKAPAEAPEPAQAQNNFNDEEKQSEEDAKRSHMFKAVKDVAEGDISIEELTKHWVWFFPVCPSCPILPGLNLSFHA